MNTSSLQKINKLRPLTDTIINFITPSTKSETSRKNIVQYLKDVLKSKNLEAFETGSFSWKAYLPDSDIDIGFISSSSTITTTTTTTTTTTNNKNNLNKQNNGSNNNINNNNNNNINNNKNNNKNDIKDNYNNNTQDLMSVNELLCIESCKLNSTDHATPSVRNVSFVSGHVKVVKCVVNNVTVDLCSLQRESLGAVSYFEALDRLIGNNHLFKRSLILIKGWCTYEGARFANAMTTSATDIASSTSSNNLMKEKNGKVGNDNNNNNNNNIIIGASKGGLSSYGLTILIASFFIQHMKPSSSSSSKNNNNNNSRPACSIQHPFDAFILFLDFYQKFDWSNYSVSMYGPVPLHNNAMANSQQQQQQQQKGQATRQRVFQSKLAFALKNRALDGSLIVKQTHDSQQMKNQKAQSLQYMMSNVHEKFSIRSCNILDPFDITNNLGRSMNLQSFQRMKNMFTNGHRCIMEILSSANKHDNSIIVNNILFHVINKTFGRGDGWRPDLLTHPCQKWYNNIDNNKNRRNDVDKNIANVSTCDNSDGRKSDSIAVTANIDVELKHDVNNGMEMDQKLLQRSISRLKKIVPSPPVIIASSKKSKLISKRKQASKKVKINVAKKKKTITNTRTTVEMINKNNNTPSTSATFISSPVNDTTNSSKKLNSKDHSKAVATTTTTTTNVYLKTLFYIIFGYLALAQIRQEIVNLTTMWTASSITPETRRAERMKSISNQYYYPSYNHRRSLSTSPPPPPPDSIYNDLDLNSEYIMMEQDLQIQQKYHINSVNMIHTYNVNNYHLNNNNMEKVEGETGSIGNANDEENNNNNNNNHQKLAQNIHNLYVLNNLKRIIAEQQARINVGSDYVPSREDNNMNEHIKITQNDINNNNNNNNNNDGTNEDKNTDNNLADLPEVYSTYSNQWVSTGSQVIFKVNVRWPTTNMNQQLYFQWRRNGVDIPGAVGHLMILNAVTIKDEGTYTCAVSNEKGNTVIWEESVLHVASPPKVKLEFVKVVVQKGDSVSLSVNLLSGTPRPKFQWRINGVDIPGAISETYTVLSANPNDVGTYTCMVANLAGSVVWEENILLLEGINPLTKKDLRRSDGGGDVKPPASIDVRVEKGEVTINI